jgi:hypothetical protein
MYAESQAAGEAAGAAGSSGSHTDASDDDVVDAEIVDEASEKPDEGAA